MSPGQDHRPQPFCRRLHLAQPRAQHRRPPKPHRPAVGETNSRRLPHRLPHRLHQIPQLPRRQTRSLCLHPHPNFMPVLCQCPSNQRFAIVRRPVRSFVPALRAANRRQQLPRPILVVEFIGMNVMAVGGGLSWGKMCGHPDLLVIPNYRLLVVDFFRYSVRSKDRRPAYRKSRLPSRNVWQRETRSYRPHQPDSAQQELPMETTINRIVLKFDVGRSAIRNSLLIVAAIGCLDAFLAPPGSSPRYPQPSSASALFPPGSPPARPCVRGRRSGTPANPSPAR